MFVLAYAFLNTGLNAGIKKPEFKSDFTILQKDSDFRLKMEYKKS